MQQAIQVPVGWLLVGGRLSYDPADLSSHHVKHPLARAYARQDLVPHHVDDLALPVHDIIVLHDVLADVEVVSLGLRLRALYLPSYEAVLDRGVLVHSEAVHEARHPVKAEAHH